jgi:predicted acyltransferase
MGGGWFFVHLAKVTGWGWAELIAEQQHHVEWAGFRFEDLIFPLFMFISGVAIPFAIKGKVERGVEKRTLFKKIFRRMVLLVVFGLVYNNVLRDGFSDIRVASVLAQIGIAYFFAAIIVLYTNSVKIRIYWLGGILAAIALLQFVVPVSGFGAGVLTPEGSINAWIDQHLLPGKLIYGTYDPEGLLCIVSATSVTLMGSLAGNILRNNNLSPDRKTIFLAVSGAGLVIVALLLSPVYPIIKKIWTVPFNLLAAGISFLLLSLFYYIVDVKGYRKWTFFFRIIGLNSITIYLGAKIIDFRHTSEFLLGWIANPMEDYGFPFIIAGVLAIKWIFLYFLYKRSIFLRV